MDCRACTDSLTALIDGELSAGQKKEVEDHFSQCGRCHEEYQSLLDSYQWVDQLSSLEPTPALWGKIHSEIIDLSTGTPPWLFALQSFFTTRWVPIAAGTLGIVILSALFLSQRNLETQQAFQAYLQHREQIEFLHVRHSHNEGMREVTAVLPNPFVVSVSSDQRNPFALE